MRNKDDCFVSKILFYIFIEYMFSNSKIKNIYSIPLDDRQIQSPIFCTYDF